MRKLRFVFVAAALAVLMACAGANAQNNRETDRNTAQEPVQRTVKHIIFVVVEGLSRERIQSAYTPNMNGLAAGGIKTEASGVLPRNAQAFLASLLTGTDPSVHGLTQKGQRVRTKLLPEIAGDYGRSSVIVSYGDTVPRELLQGRGTNPTGNVKAAKNSSEAVVSQAIDVFGKSRPYFLGIMVPGIIDDTGDADSMAKTVNAVDEQIGRLFVALRSCGVYEDSMIVITGCTGEGGGPKGAGSLMVPVMMAGPGLKSGIELPPVRITDVTPTVALLAGIQMPPESNGMILWNALRSGTGFLEENLLKKRIKDLSEENIRSTELVYRLTEEKRLVREEKENVDREKAQIQQTIQGKDRQIKLLKWEIRFLKLLELITIAALAAGYVVEYIYLRKKFLMF